MSQFEYGKIHSIVRSKPCDLDFFNELFHEKRYLVRVNLVNKTELIVIATIWSYTQSFILKNYTQTY